MLAHNQTKKERRSAHRTQWAAQFAVASELCKRGYEVALTMGNHPIIDLMVISPKRVQFAIDVKGLYKKNYWPVREQPARENLFYVFAFVPTDAPNEFFVLTQDQVNEGLRRDFEHVSETAKSKGRVFDRTRYFPCVSWKYAFDFKSVWNVLPE